MAQHSDKSTSDDLLQIRCNSEFKQEVRVLAAKAEYDSMSAYVRDTLREKFPEGPQSEISMSSRNGATGPETTNNKGGGNSQNSEGSDELSTDLPTESSE